jgi:hypothetical protein
VERQKPLALLFYLAPHRAWDSSNLNPAIGSVGTRAHSIYRRCGSLPFDDGLSCNASGSYTASLQVPTEHYFSGKEREVESGNDY